MENLLTQLNDDTSHDIIIKPDDVKGATLEDICKIIWLSEQNNHTIDVDDNDFGLIEYFGNPYENHPNYVEPDDEYAYENYCLCYTICANSDEEMLLLTYIKREYPIENVRTFEQVDELMRLHWKYKIFEWKYGHYVMQKLGIDEDILYPW